MLTGFCFFIFIFVVTVVAIVLVAGVDLDPNRKMSPTFPYPHGILAKRACITWTAPGHSQMQNSMRLKSLHEYMLGVRHWRHVALRHESNDFAFPGNIDFAADDQRIFMYLLFIKGSCVYSSMKQCLQSVNHEQSPIQMTQNNKHNKWLEILDFQPKLLWRTPT